MPTPRRLRTYSGGFSPGTTDVSALANAYRPAGAVAENFTRYGARIANTATTSATGTMRLMACYIRSGVTVTNVNFICGGTAPTASTHLWAALYTPALALMAQSTDDTSATPWTANTAKALPLATAQPINSSGVYWVGLLETVSSGNMPTFDGIDAPVITATAIPPVLFGDSNTGLTTTAPATATAASANGASHIYLYLT